VLRAMSARYSIARFESRYTENRIETSNADRIRHVKNKNFRLVKSINADLTLKNISHGVITANQGREWGKAMVQENFGEWNETV
jgi:hypothetical protein